MPSLEDIEDALGGKAPSYFFAGAKPGDPLSYQSLLARRKIAEALMGKRSRFPQNAGEGLTYLGESIYDIAAQRKLDEAEKAREGQVTAETLRAIQALPGEGAAAVSAPVPASVPAAVADEATPEVSYGTRRIATPGAGVPSPAPPAPPGPMPVGAYQTRNLMTDQAVTRDLPQVQPEDSPEAYDAARTRLAAALAQQAQQRTGGAQTPPMAAMAQANPPTPTTIPRAPSAGIPGPLEPPTPVMPPEEPDMRVRPERIKPVPPTPTPMSLEERHAVARSMNQDPGLAGPWATVAAKYAAQRAAADARNIEQYKGDLSTYEKLRLADEAALEQAPKLRSELREKQQAYEIKQREEQDKALQGGLSNQAVETALAESRKEVANVPSALGAIRRARELVAGDAKMYSGGAANLNTALSRLVTAFGNTPDPRLSATEQYRINIAPIIAQYRQMLAGNANVSDKDMEASREAAAGNINLTPETLNKVLGTMEGMMVDAAIGHNKRVLTLSGNDPDRQRVRFGAFGFPNMETVVPSYSVKLLREHYQENPAAAVKEFDEKFHYPGLAMRLLSRR